MFCSLLFKRPSHISTETHSFLLSLSNKVFAWNRYFLEGQVVLFIHLLFQILLYGGPLCMYGFDCMKVRFLLVESETQKMNTNKSKFKSCSSESLVFLKLKIIALQI